VLVARHLDQTREHRIGDILMSLRVHKIISQIHQEPEVGLTVFEDIFRNFDGLQRIGLPEEFELGEDKLSTDRRIFLFLQQCIVIRECSIHVTPAYRHGLQDTLPGENAVGMSRVVSDKDLEPLDLLVRIPDRTCGLE